MVYYLRLLASAAIIFSEAPSLAAPGASVQVKVRAQVIKPLILTSTQNIDFGTILMTNVTAANVVSISGSGAITCGAGLTCSATGKPAIFNVSGSNKQVVTITSAATNISNGTTNLPFTPSAPASVTLTNSGATGIDFNVGGSFSVDQNTTDGVYTGILSVTVDYQ